MEAINLQNLDRYTYISFFFFASIYSDCGEFLFELDDIHCPRNKKMAAKASYNLVLYIYT